jgi:hypothetical protein
VPSDQENRNWYSRIVWIALVLVVTLGVGDAALAPMPAPMQPDFIDTVLASRAVVVAIRIAIVFAALFLVLSVAALIVRRQWLTRVGPVEVEKVEVLDAKSEDFGERLRRADQAIKVLEEKVAYARQLIDREAR